jgi:hypothetical protein
MTRHGRRTSSGTPPRTRSCVMYVPPHPPTSVPDAERAIIRTGPYPVRPDQHYDAAVSLKMELLFSYGTLHYNIY